MKYILLVAITVLLSSCSSKPTVTIEMQNYTKSDWILVSVRDTSVIVLPTYEAIGRDLAFTHCVVIPTRAISRIILHRQTTFLERIPMALFGMGVGLALRACSCDDRLYHIVLGGVIGYNLSIIRLLFASFESDAYFLWLPSDRDLLRKQSVFPTEPDIMQYVR